VNKRTLVRSVAALTLGTATFLSACREDPLAVANLNQPDVERALGTARLTETAISKLFQQMFNGQYAVGGDAIWTQTLVMAFESSSQLGNFGMGTRSSIPRPPIDNSIGNGEAAGNFRDYDLLSRNARSAANTINRLNAFIESGVGTGTDARDAKALSFAYFSLGYALGHISLIYDQAAILTPELFIEDNELVPDLSPYGEVNAAALAMLDEAITIANSPEATTGTGGWPIPQDWLRTENSAGTDRAEWIRIIRSYKAKFRAGVARTPAERTAVDWNAVIADATNGISEDLIILASTTLGWNMVTLNQLAIASSWSQMTPFILGMADTSGGYQAWLQQPLNSRTPFLMHTPDDRFPEGATREAQQTNSGGTATTGPPESNPLLYFRMRPAGDDAANHPWGVWYYDNHRFWGIRAGGGNGPFVLMAKAESDMLAAEGYLRTGQVAAAVPLINFYRTRAGLPAIPATNDVNTQVPGGAGCVPQVPVATAVPPATVCGNVFEAMKWEKRVETSFTGHAQWFMDARGWGDLYVDTPLEWPVPYQELFARQMDSYTTERRAGVGTYGFGRSATY
jgi:hypothetical protein